jgi:hypothetical protein
MLKEEVKKRPEFYIPQPNSLQRNSDLKLQLAFYVKF